MQKAEHVRVPRVTRTCSARVTFVFRALHVRVPVFETVRFGKSLQTFQKMFAEEYIKIPLSAESYEKCSLSKEGGYDSIFLRTVLSQHRNKVFSQQISAAYKPDVEQSCEDEWFCTCLFELVQACVSSKCRHRHG